MNSQLWRWSTTVQISSALLVALFFVALLRSTQRAELRLWVGAWLANLCALGMTLVYWIPPAQSESLLLLVRFPYIFFKCAFVALIVIGAFSFGRVMPSRAVISRLMLAVLAYGIVVALSARTLDMVGMLMSATIALTLLSASVVLVLRRHATAGWLAAGFALRGSLGLLEAVAHGTRVISGPDVEGGASVNFVSMSSSFDAGAEWMIALGCVLAMYGTIGRELTHINQDLEATKDELRILSHRDPLTGVFNRRRLPDILNDSRLTGATILFFDLDDFKDINDVHGHHVGDEALRRFARVLLSSFRPADHVIRYAGDEFIVVGQGIEQVDVRERIDLLRETLEREHLDGLRIRFAVGEAYLPVGGDPEAAIRAADAAMYRRKGEQKQRLA
jgi:diguanylate cyclase (GGDEF)-like protein